MKHRSLISQRDADFADCLRAAARTAEIQNRRPSRAELIDEALAARPRRFYIAFNTARTKLRLMRSAGTFNSARCGGNLTYARWAEFNQAVDRYLCRTKDATLDEAITHVVHFERPSRFYLSSAKAGQLFRKTLRCESRFRG